MYELKASGFKLISYSTGLLSVSLRHKRNKIEMKQKSWRGLWYSRSWSRNDKILSKLCRNCPNDQLVVVAGLEWVARIARFQNQVQRKVCSSLEFREILKRITCETHFLQTYFLSLGFLHSNIIIRKFTATLRVTTTCHTLVLTLVAQCLQRVTFYNDTISELLSPSFWKLTNCRKLEDELKKRTYMVLIYSCFILFSSGLSFENPK